MASQPCLFFRLPREIRDEIYEYAYSSHDCSMKYYIVQKREFTDQVIEVLSQISTACLTHQKQDKNPANNL